MASRVPARRSGCPISFALDLLGDRWSLLVVRDLVLKQKRYFGEFLDSEEGIATNILSDRLARLEAASIVSRTRDPQDGKRVIYRVTARGRDLIPVLVEMIVWSARHDPATAAPAAFVRRAVRDRDKLIQELRAAVGSVDGSPDG